MVHVYRLSESALKTVSAAAKIATEVLLPNAADVDARGRYPAESLKALADAGLFGLCLSGDVGGKGEGMRAFCASRRATVWQVCFYCDGLCDACCSVAGNCDLINPEC